MVAPVRDRSLRVAAHAHREFAATVGECSGERALELLDELEGEEDTDGEAIGVTIAFASLEEPGP